jgi:hypothetical protein
MSNILVIIDRQIHMSNTLVIIYRQFTCPTYW